MTRKVKARLSRKASEKLAEVKRKELISSCCVAVPVADTSNLLKMQEEKIAFMRSLGLELVSK